MKKKVYSNPDVQVYALTPMQVICNGSPTGDAGIGGGLGDIPGVPPISADDPITGD